MGRIVVMNAVTLDGVMQGRERTPGAGSPTAAGASDPHNRLKK